LAKPQVPRTRARRTRAEWCAPVLVNGRCGRTTSSLVRPILGDCGLRTTRLRVASFDSLFAPHASGLGPRSPGTFGRDVLARLREHVVAHIDEPIAVATLARIAGHSRYHFSRVFARSVGITPHRYVVHLRLQRAIELIRDGRSSLAETAARTGFADQSHLSRWVRRVYGISLTQFVSRVRSSQTPAAHAHSTFVVRAARAIA
jgi:AraC-like DNA-binding protein